MSSGIQTNIEAISDYARKLPHYEEEADKFRDLIDTADVTDEAWGIMGVFAKQGYTERLEELRSLLGELKDGVDGFITKLNASAPTEARRRAGRKIFEHQAELDAKRHRRVAPPALRERVEELMRARWREPILVLRLDENAKLTFDVPGRRTDGTVRGKKLVRRFFVNIARGIGLAVAAFLTLSSGNGLGNGGRKNSSAKKPVHVQGPADAMALNMVDTFRRAEGSWLVCSPSHLALVDTGSPLRGSADAPEPEIIWEGRRPHLPEIRLRTRTLLWPDGSRFTFPLAGRPEERHLRDHLTQPDTTAND